MQNCKIGKQKDYKLEAERIYCKHLNFLKGKDIFYSPNFFQIVKSAAIGEAETNLIGSFKDSVVVYLKQK